MRKTDARDASERDYLSIREVLELLVAEFPEVTISKIRFLESRGLIHPERTPSGYRKFYEGDVERLRWILRQQREHFLPLKVIKGRLDDANSDETPSGEASLFDQPFEVPVEEPATLVGVGGRSETISASSAVRAPAAAERRESSLGGLDGPSEPIVDNAAPVMQVPTPKSERAGREHRPSVPRAPALTTTKTITTETVTTEIVPPPSLSPASAETVNEEKTSPLKNPATPVRAANVNALGGATFSIEELAGATGATPQLIKDLESFGLLTSRDIAGEQCFDDDSVVIARAAAGFAAFGIEPRHLRSFKHAAERDASLFSQVVVPLLRQRNPEARGRARSDLEQLASLGTALRQVLLEIELRPYTGG